MKVLLFQLDGPVPNIALMRIAAHHRSLGHSVELRHTGSPRRELWDEPEWVYGSAIFEKTRPTVEVLLGEFPRAIIGGTGVDVASSLEAHGITTAVQDYSVYPRCRCSIGFTQRGCRLACAFCVVPKKEGKMREEQSIADIWRGEPWPRELLLLDNDFFGQPRWRDRIAEIREGGFKVSFNQGINARFLSDRMKEADEAAAALASLDYRDGKMRERCIYTAWDNRKDEEILFQGLNRLVKHGVNPKHITVYMLIGYWPGETDADRVYRQRKLREFGCRPYPMPFYRTRELVGFQRWVLGHYDKMGIAWDDFKAAGYEPRKLSNPDVEDSQALFLK